MIHDREVLDRLDGFPKETFSGHAFRPPRQSLDPLVSSTSGGRWMANGVAAVLYTSLQREGSLAEISFHWSQLSPRPTKPAVVHTLGVIAHRTLKLSGARRRGADAPGE